VRTDEDIKRIEELVRSDRLREQIRKKERPHMWRNSLRLHHDNASAHSVFQVKEFLAKKNITVVEHAPYLPDLAPSDFFLIPRIKNTVKGEHFDDVDEIKCNTAIALNGISENDFQACFQSWETCMQQCVHAE
jgi:transposase